MEVFIPVIGVALFIGLLVMSKKSAPTELVEVEGIEVFRGAPDVVDFALQVLCDGGVPAWTEETDTEHIAIHVEEEQVPLVQHVLEESKLRYA